MFMETAVPAPIEGIVYAGGGEGRLLLHRVATGLRPGTERCPAVVPPSCNQRDDAGIPCTLEFGVRCDVNFHLSQCNLFKIADRLPKPFSKSRKVSLATCNISFVLFCVNCNFVQFRAISCNFVQFGPQMGEPAIVCYRLVPR